MCVCSSRNPSGHEQHELSLSKRVKTIRSKAPAQRCNHATSSACLLKTILCTASTPASMASAQPAKHGIHACQMIKRTRSPAQLFIHASLISPHADEHSSALQLPCQIISTPAQEQKLEAMCACLTHDSDRRPLKSTFSALFAFVHGKRTRSSATSPDRPLSTASHAWHRTSDTRLKAPPQRRITTPARPTPLANVRVGGHPNVRELALYILEAFLTFADLAKSSRQFLPHVQFPAFLGKSRQSLLQLARVPAKAHVHESYKMLVWCKIVVFVEAQNNRGEPTILPKSFLGA